MIIVPKRKVHFRPDRSGRPQREKYSFGARWSAANGTAERLQQGQTGNCSRSWMSWEAKARTPRYPPSMMNAYGFF